MNIATPPGWDASPSQLTPWHSIRLSQQFTGTYLYTKVGRGNVRVKSLVQEHSTMTPVRARTWGPFLKSSGNFSGP